MLGARVIDGHIRKLKAMCGGFPEVEVRARDHYAFLVRGKKFAYYLIDHHGDGRVTFQCKAERGINGALVSSDPRRFHLPAYMAHHGWIGIYMDVTPIDWDQIELFLDDAYRLVAPKSVVRALDAARLG